MDPPVVSVVVPTRGRAAYLEVTLDSLRDQRGGIPHEILVVDDGAGVATADVVAARPGVRHVAHGSRRGLNAARNSGVGASSAPLIAFVDDDVLVPPLWLDALADGARRHPEAEAFGGPIRPRFEGRTPRGCGREEPPITTLDLGAEDREASFVWGANLAVRRSAIERIGPFDEGIWQPHGDEEEWLERLTAAGGRIVYLAAAGLDHRRVAPDARLRPLARAAYARGRGARASDARRGREPSLAGELRVLAGCGWHTLRRACPQGVVMGAHSAGRLAEALRPRPPFAPDSALSPGAPEFLSGDAGDVTHPWRRTKRALGDLAFEALDRATLVGRRADALAHSAPSRRVLAIGVYRPGSVMAEAVERLGSERHDVRLALGATAATDPALAAHTVAERLAGGKFENLNRVLEAAAEAEPAAGGAHAGQPSFDWVVVLDDDLVLPERFLDRFIGLCERFELELAQPAQSQRSHSAWRVTRRRPASLVRETRFVEIGPLTAFGRRAAAALLPFPELRFGWGLDLHWAALAAERGWRLGVVDATPVRHEAATVGSAYATADAQAEAARFLGDHPYLPAARAGDVVATHRRAVR